MIDNPKDLGKALKNNQDRIEIEADFAKKIIKIKGVGKVAWGILIVSLGVAVYSIIGTAASGGTSTPVTGSAAFLSTGAAATTLGPSVTYAAVMIAVSGGGVAILNKLRKYKLEKTAGKYYLIK